MVVRNSLRILFSRLYYAGRHALLLFINRLGGLGLVSGGSLGGGGGSLCAPFYLPFI